ncbi:hypothetical protein T12_6386 [Trichinella patagoniensis]|uniref:Uncharacterized protein n=1 Tax=Trichinella patagoniensis TaxID=990121 RepID=A0A0V1AFW8_9BILA|nr:hypothetical protein T12_6386 [Trichinella patagoniensis]
MQNLSCRDELIMKQTLSSCGSCTKSNNATSAFFCIDFENLRSSEMYVKLLVMLCVRMQNTRNKPPYAIHGKDMKNGRNTTNEQDASEYWLSVQMRFAITARRLSLITII